MNGEETKMVMVLISLSGELTVDSFLSVDVRRGLVLGREFTSLQGDVVMFTVSVFFSLSVCLEDG